MKGMNVNMLFILVVGLRERGCMSSDSLVGLVDELLTWACWQGMKHRW